MPYTYGVLRLDKSNAADEHNSRLLTPYTVGVEMYDPIYATMCGLGNVGHQKRGDREIAACEVALDDPIHPDGTIYVTSRPDLDSFGYMAIKALREEGRGGEIDKTIVSCMSGQDCYGYLEFARRFPDLAEAFPEGLEIRAMNIIARQTGRIDTGTRIGDYKRILTRRASRKELQQIIALRVRPNWVDFKVTMYDCLAFIEAPGNYDAARNFLGNLHPISVVSDPGFRRNGSGSHKRFSVVFQRGGTSDWHGFHEAINNLEATKRGVSLERLAEIHSLWGGHEGWNVSSPVGVGRETILTTADVLQTAHRFL